MLINSECASVNFMSRAPAWPETASYDIRGAALGTGQHVTLASSVEASSAATGTRGEGQGVETPGLVDARVLKNSGHRLQAEETPCAGSLTHTSNKTCPVDSTRHLPGSLGRGRNDGNLCTHTSVWAAHRNTGPLGGSRSAFKGKRNSVGSGRVCM